MKFALQKFKVLKDLALLLDGPVLQCFYFFLLFSKFSAKLFNIGERRGRARIRLVVRVFLLPFAVECEWVVLLLELGVTIAHSVIFDN